MKKSGEPMQKSKADSGEEEGAFDATAMFGMVKQFAGATLELGKLDSTDLKAWYSELHIPGQLQSSTVGRCSQRQF
jgi:hypothetical protein